jgi:hypothetical protein
MICSCKAGLFGVILNIAGEPIIECIACGEAHTLEHMRNPETLPPETE